MILFKELTYKNFLSTGNNAIKIDLNRSRSTLIVGTNGTGKSTILDAISFALFNKPHRNVKRGGLVNSVNGKGCEVTIEFDTAGHTWKVLRGIKPNKFEVYQNDKMIDQQTNVRDYQKFLEQNILKLNHKSFHQIVVLGSSSFIPFMQLKAWDRRDVIEDLLDIGVFSKMKTVLKQRNNIQKDLAKSSRISLDNQKDKIEYQKKHISQLENINKSAKMDFEEDIINAQNEMDSLKSKLDKYPLGLRGTLNSLRKVREGLQTEKGKHTHSMKELVSKAKFFEVNTACPTCTQEISENVKNSMLTDVRAQAQQTQKDIELNNIKYDETIETLEKVQDQISDMANINSQMSTQTDIMAKLANKQVKEVDIDAPAKELVDMTYDLIDIQDNLTEAEDQILYNNIASEMLKDTGIRTKIIKEYLPVMNNLINKYLQTLEFFVAFHLNENFEESIKSRHRDEFVYANFSEGEKMRIDLSLLFAWRQVAKMKNSTNTNLLILDETFDSSLDDEGTDNLMKILKTLEKGTNTFIISHKPDVLESKMEQKIQFVKKNNFSAIS